MNGEPINTLVKRALDFGFSHAAPLDPTSLKIRREVRDMCAADKCKSFNNCWVCPPGCGELEEHKKTIALYTGGLLVQTTADLEDDFDYESMSSAGVLQKERMVAFRKLLLPEFGHLLALGNGGCNLCERCTYPGSPCRKPEQTMVSMEAFGLFVSEVCGDNGLGYHYGPRTITYTGCYLFK
ncbi:MAG: DUF2284 domain-containing protein [Oscillospiraceae bacterium]|nr:DUF2284 domain-containing protein [Oscillospiraceae bacterium]